MYCCRYITRLAIGSRAKWLLLAWFWVLSPSSIVVASQAEAMAPVDWKLTLLDGEPWSLEAERGRWVVVNFWATWCAPCIKELPALASFARQHPQRVTVLGVNYERITPTALQQFLHDHGVDFAVASWPPHTPDTPLGTIRAVPTTIVVSPQGKIAFRHHGEIDQAQLETLLLL